MTRLGIPLFLFSFLLFVVSSCYREQTTLVTVITKDSQGNFVENVQVRLYAEPTGTSDNQLEVDLTKNTNSKGEAYFNLSSVYEPGQNGVGIFAITCQKLNLIGNGTVEVLQEENNVVEIILL